MSSTPADLVKFAIALMNAERMGESDTRESTIVKLMRQAHGRKFGADIWGLGAMLYAPVSNGDNVFGHDGANDPAINTAFRINPTTNDAIIVLATGNKTLASSIAYEWTLWQTGYPDFLALDKAIGSALIPGAIGLMLIALCLILLLLSRRL